MTLARFRRLLALAVIVTIALGIFAKFAQVADQTQARLDAQEQALEAGR